MFAPAAIIALGLLAVGWYLPFSMAYEEPEWSKGIDCSTQPIDGGSTPSVRRASGYAPHQPFAYEAEFIITNEELSNALQLTVCAYDRDLGRLFFHQQTLQPRRFPNSNLYQNDYDRADIVYTLPPTDVVVIAEARGPGESLARVANTAHVPTCPGHGVLYIMMDLELRSTGSQADLFGSGCTKSFPHEGWTGARDGVRKELYDGDGALLVLEGDVFDWRSSAAAATGAVIAAIALSVPRLRWGLLLLFSRLRPHRLLDQRVRASIHEAVANDPGVHVGELARRLGVGATTVAHHVRIMARDGLVHQVPRGSRRHVFIHGRYSPLEMRVLSEWRDPNTRRFLLAAERQPSASVGALAASAGLRRPAASKILRRLRRDEIVSATRAGRTLRLELSGPAAAIIRRVAAPLDRLLAT